VHPPEVLHAWLAARDPQRAAAVEPGDRYRVARALEIALASRAPSAAREREPERTSLRDEGLPYLKIALDVAQSEIDARISARVATMLDAGLVEEAERIGTRAVAADAVGYPQAFAYLAGWSTHAELAASLARATRRYARRQFTWFRREPDIVWSAPRDVSAAVCETLGWRMRSEST
jgi:tRNA dimethylallyltransferase